MQTTSTSPTDSPATAPAPRSGEPRRAPVLRFARHYAEMLVAMFLGMFVLGLALAVPLELAGVNVSNWHNEAPALLLLGMAVTMTVPMVAWMRHRGHGWAPSWEMAGSMFVPSFAAVALLWTGAQTDVDVLLGIQHIAMLPSMLAVMLLRRREYSSH